MPPNLIKLTHLTHLDLSHNQLTNMSPDLDHISNLTNLDLSQLTHLTHLDLSHNQIAEIPPALSQLPPLLSLDLRDNPLSACPLPLRWRIDRYIFPPDILYFDFDHWYLSSPTSTEHPDLPFLDLCVE